MPCFDNSMVYSEQSSSPIKPYHSYMSRSKDGYLIKDSNKFVNSNRYNHLWNVSQEDYIGSKPTHISKLRNILSETISNVTKGNNLQKGESVELTLEIELMKTKNNTPTNSLVEVTIIQHNKREKRDTNNNMTKNMDCQFETKSSTSESASQRRRNWFHRVIHSRPYGEKRLYKDCAYKETEKISLSNWKMKGDPILSINKNLKPDEDKHPYTNPKNNFVTVLPENKPINIDYIKGYRKVSPNKGNFESVGKKPRNIMTVSRKDYLVKKISDIFLPTKKADKNKAVKTALTALKNEVENIKLHSERHNGNTNIIKEKRGPVHNLGKLVSNILVDVMENSDSSKNRTEGNSVPLRYQNFFEPVSKGKNINTRKQLNKRNIFSSYKCVTNSHSDTCCVNPKLGLSGPTVKTSKSLNDCRTSTKIKTEIGRQVDIIKQTSPQKINKSEEKHYGANQRKKLKSYAKNQSNHRRNTRRLKHKLISSKNSEIEWNGQKIQINREVKGRIEMLIVNELQNLALKEGMECDVTPLPPTEDNGTKITNTIEKMSSFVCELDISDRKLKKVIQNKRKEDKHHSYTVNKERSKHSAKHTKRKKNMAITVSGNIEQNTLTKQIRTSVNSKSTRNDIKFKNNKVRISPTVKEVKSLIHMDKMEMKQNDVEVKYLNKNVKNWSAESNTITFSIESTNPKESEKTNLAITSEEPPGNICDTHRCDQNTMASGFVKKIESDDSTWNNFLSRQEPDNRLIDEKSSKKLVTVASTKTAIKFDSATSNECESIEIELDIKDLELILKEAKQKQKADKVLISAKCKNDTKKQKKMNKFTGKNSPSYTEQLLSSAAKKLEKYVKKQ